MQRFAKEYFKVMREAESGKRSWSDLHVKRMRYAMAKNGGRFVYGANGTLTQAARWRLNAFSHLSLMAVGIQKRITSPAYRTFPGFTLADLTHHASAAKSKLQSAREGGCRLP
jgi:hypothetical protein